MPIAIIARAFIGAGAAGAVIGATGAGARLWMKSAEKTREVAEAVFEEGVPTTFVEIEYKASALKELQSVEEWKRELDKAEDDSRPWLLESLRFEITALESIKHIQGDSDGAIEASIKERQALYDSEYPKR